MIRFWKLLGAVLLLAITQTASAQTGNWVISGGTGIYEGLQGTGKWVADGSHFPYFIHTETGTVHWTGK